MHVQCLAQPYHFYGDVLDAKVERYDIFARINNVRHVPYDTMQERERGSVCVSRRLISSISIDQKW